MNYIFVYTESIDDSVNISQYIVNINNTNNRVDLNDIKSTKKSCLVIYIKSINFNCKNKYWKVSIVFEGYKYKHC